MDLCDCVCELITLGSLTMYTRCGIDCLTRILKC
uniref:Uncharacterized protein n=1 Tax=Anguilla anguilla TaxID=7936 RepID=A0A0E9UH49_ANGAN